MKCDIYNDIYAKLPTGRPRDVMHYLERIRTGAVANEVSAIRMERDKVKRDELKKMLKGVTFAGTFSRRNADYLKEASGLCVMDLDKFKDESHLIETKRKLTENKHVFAVWISPSGNGLKFLVKIPRVTSKSEYTARYEAIYNEFLWIGEDILDKSGKDISRLCFESYDPEIYVNEDSETFFEIQESNVVEYQNLGVVTNVPLIDQDEIANRLMTWFKKHFNPSQRNNSFHKLALAFNDFGVSKSICERYILPNAQRDFTANEIQQLINSAYKHTANFGSKQFEDKVKQKALKAMTMVGKSNAEIVAKFPELDAEKIENELQAIRSEVNLEQFWQIDNEGKLKISPHRLKFYLEAKNFFKHYPISNAKTFTFITKEDNFVDEVSEFQIKDHVLESLLNTGNLDAYDLMASNTKTFTPVYLSMLSTAQFTIEQDTEEIAWIYYRNVALRVTKSERQTVDYSELDGFVWKKQVIQRDWIPADHHESEYRTFLWLCSSKDVAKYNSLKSVIGYLMHSYKTSANNKAIIFNDEKISDLPNGGSGKSLFWNAIKYVKKVADLDGKTFEFSKSFPYQSVPTDTQLLVFDDVKKNFNFENLFSIITEGITLEYKGQDAIKIPVARSPKILITTNYTINGAGGSFERRKFEVEMSSYFNANHSPLDEFGHMLFDSWDDLEWARFDHFMINCLEYYLQNGLVPFPTVNLNYRKLINETSQEFIEWMNDNDMFEFGARIYKNQFFDKIINEIADFKKYLTQKRFTQWIIKWCEFHGYKYSDGNTNGMRWFVVSKPETKDVWEDMTPIEEEPF